MTSDCTQFEHLSIINKYTQFILCILLLAVPSANGVSITGVTAAVTSSVIVILVVGVLDP